MIATSNDWKTPPTDTCSLSVFILNEDGHNENDNLKVVQETNENGIIRIH